MTIISSKPKRAPGPRGSFIWGALAQFKRDPIGFLSQSVHDHGDVVRLRFGPIVSHLVNRPEHIEHVLSRNAARYDKNTRSVSRIQATCGDSLLSANQDAWQRHRRLIQPVFQPRYLEDIGGVIDASMAPMLDRWHGIARQNGTVDIVSEMMHLVISTSAKILFSSNVDVARIEAALDVILTDTWRRIEAPLDPSMISPMFHRRAFKDAVAEIDDVIFGIIKERRKTGSGPDDLLSRLLVAHESEGETQLTDQELRDAAVTLLLAGHETTANALASAFQLVAQSPDAGFETANLHHIFAETIRLHPSIWIIERRALEDDQIGPYHIARGTNVLISPYLLHRHPEYWPNPNQFDPSRFEPHNVDQRPRHAYIPFGLGAHRCVGLHMATAMATRIMANVYERFKLQRPSGQATAMAPGITLRHSGEIRLVVTDA